jgi:hypothetical protein
MMLRLMGIVLAGGLLLGTAGAAQAQVGIAIGNPVYGNGVYVGAPSVGVYPGYGYSSGYGGYVAPRAYVAPRVYGYGYPAYRPAYGYGGYGYGYRRGGYRPFRRW